MLFSIQTASSQKLPPFDTCAKKQGPQIVLDPPVLKFGKVSVQNATASKTVKLYNKGDSDLIITNLRVSCGCVSVSFKSGKNKSPYFGIYGSTPGWKEKIAPASYAELTVILDLTDYPVSEGIQIKDIFISSNGTRNPELILKVEMETIK